MSIADIYQTEEQTNFLKHVSSYKPSNFSSENSALDCKGTVEAKILQTKTRQFRPLQPTLLKIRKDIYVNFSSPKVQPEISRMCFPYFMEQDKPEKENKKPTMGIKITNRIFTKKFQNKNGFDLKMNRIQNQQPPVNQYLSYDLSCQINSGIFEVKILAQEIKRIKKQKQEALEDQNKYKPKNQIRIAKSYKCGFLSRKMNQTMSESYKKKTQINH